MRVAITVHQFCLHTYVVLFVLLSATAAHAYEFNFQKEIIGVETGLPQSTVRGITQDRHGLMYFATDDGVSQYNGVTHRRIHTGTDQDRNLFSFSDVCHLNDFLIAPSFDGGFLIYSVLTEDSTEHYLSELFNATAGTQVVDCESDAKTGLVWLVTEKGLFSIRPNSVTEVDVVGTYWLSNEGFPNHRINRVVKHRNMLYLATNKGMLLYDFGQLVSLPLENLGEVNVKDILFESDEFLWVLLEHGVAKYQLEDLTWRLKDMPLLHKLNRELLPEKNSRVYITDKGDIWVSTETKGMFVLSTTTNKLLHLHRNSNDYQIPDNHIVSIFQSKDGVVWLGSWLSGVIKLKFPMPGINRITEFKLADKSVEVPSIRSIFQDEKDNWWIGTDSDGILVADSLAGTFQQFDRDADVNLPSDSIRTFYQLSDGRMLVGTENGLGYFDPSSGYQVLTDATTPAVVDSLKADSNISNKVAMLANRSQVQSDVEGDPNQTVSQSLVVGSRIRSVLEDKAKRLWIGTYDRGLFYYSFHENRFYHVPLLGNGIYDKVSLLTSDNPNQLWVATDNAGMFVIDLNRMVITEHFHAEKRARLRAPGNSVWSLLKDNDRELWLGTYGQGLGRLNLTTKIFDYFDVSSGLPNDVIYSILPDEQNHLWMSTNRGIARFDRDTFNVASYFKVHGLPHDEFNSGAYFRSKLGSLLFGTVKGIVHLSPKKLNDNQPSYEALIDDILVNGISIHDKQADAEVRGFYFKPTLVEVGNNFQKLQFSFATNEYRELALNEFRFRLLGFEDQWQYVESSNRNISYSNLSPGDYRLELQVKSTNGIWSTVATTVDIQLLPPWYASGWAYVGYVLLFISVLLGSIELFNRYRRRNSEMLQRLHYMVEHRTQELKSKNEQLEQLNSELQNANEKLEKVSMTDALTGLGNRRMLYQFLERDIGDVNRAYISLDSNFENLKEVQNHDLLIFLIDIDHFKDINDQYGHAVGDKLLIEISQILTKISREGDLVIRYGGEEFLLLMRDTSRSEGDYIAQRLLDSFRSHKFRVNQDSNIIITCSVGYAPYPFSSFYPSQLLPEQVIQIADLCLYTAKSSGRDCSVGLVGHYSEKEVTISEVMNEPELLIKNGLLDIYSSLDFAKLKWQSKEQV